MTFNQTFPADTAASDIAAYVLIDPDVLFRMQGDATIAQTGLGANFAVVQTAGSTTIGRSKMLVMRLQLQLLTRYQLGLLIFMTALQVRLAIPSLMVFSVLMRVISSSILQAYKGELAWLFQERKC